MPRCLIKNKVTLVPSLCYILWYLLIEETLMWSSYTVPRSVTQLKLRNDENDRPLTLISWWQNKYFTTTLYIDSSEAKAEIDPLRKLQMLIISCAVGETLMRGFSRWRIIKHQAEINLCLLKVNDSIDGQLVYEVMWSVGIMPLGFCFT